MYKAGDVVVNRRGDVVTLELFNKDTNRIRYMVNDCPPNLWWKNSIFIHGKCGKSFRLKREYDIVGYHQKTPKIEETTHQVSDGLSTNVDGHKGRLFPYMGGVDSPKIDGDEKLHRITIEPKEYNTDKDVWIDPQHYTRLSPQPIDVIAAWGA